MLSPSTPNLALQAGLIPYLAVFDGVSWEPFCNATTAPAFEGGGLQVFALQMIGSTMYVGGTFQNANGKSVELLDRQQLVAQA